MVNYHVLNDSVVLNYSGKTLVVSKSDERFEPVIQAIKENRLDDIPGLVEIERAFNGGGIELRDGLLHIDGTPLPPELSKRILAFRDSGLPYQPLLNFWSNLKQNPSFNSRQMLYKFLEHNGHPLTEDGHFIAYRGVSNEFKDLHSGRFDNSPGKVCEVPRDQVDDNPNNTCSFGLHVACYDYAKGFGPKLVEVKVNPKDVVAVPTDYNGTKMRVSRFEVIQEGEVMRTEHLYGHESEEDTGIDYEDLDNEEEEKSQEQIDVENGDCPSCGATIDDIANYCSDCGEDVGQYRS